MKIYFFNYQLNQIIKNGYFFFLIILTLSACGSNNKKLMNISDTETQTSLKYSSWQDRWKVKADSSIDMAEFARVYNQNPERWNKAFIFLSNPDLKELETGRYDIDGDNLFAKVDEYETRDEPDTRYEAHRRYADIQYLIKGKEYIGVLSLDKMNEIVPYSNG
jgi:hypothetical protein